jgi:hypothetical protein
MVTFDDKDNRFGAYAKSLSDQAAYKKAAPERAWNEMKNYHNQAVSGQLDDAGIAKFKDLRHDWNRKYKNTPVGIMASGVNLDENPFGAQDLYHDMSAQLFFDQPKTYDTMYPYSPGRMSQNFGKALENTLSAQFIKSLFGGRDRETPIPENVLKMRERFPGVTSSADSNLYNDDFNIFDIYLENSQIPRKPEPYFGRGELPEDFDYSQFQTIADEVLDNEITNNIDVEIKQKPPFPLTEEEIFNNQYSFVDENQDLTPYEWVDIMIDRFPGMTREKIIENGIFDGVLIEN